MKISTKINIAYFITVFCIVFLLTSIDAKFGIMFLSGFVLVVLYRLVENNNKKQQR